MNLVVQFGVSPPPKKLDEQYKPSEFTDEVLRQKVRDLSLATTNRQPTQSAQPPQTIQPAQPAAKRRKITKEPSSSLSFVVGQLCQIIKTEPPDDMRAIADLEPRFLSVPPFPWPPQG